MYNKLREFAKRVQQHEAIWNIVALLCAAVYVCARILTEQKTTFLNWSLIFKAMSEAAVPVVLLLIVRYWALYHRHGPCLEEIIKLLNMPAVSEEIREYVYDAHRDENETLRLLLGKEGACLEAKKKFELACYLLHKQKNDNPSEYCATMIGFLGRAWKDMGLPYEFFFRRGKVNTNLLKEFEALAEVAAQRGIEHYHKRLLVLSVDQIAEIEVGDVNANFLLKLIKWHEKLAALKSPEEDVLRIIILKQKNTEYELSIGFKEWANNLLARSGYSNIGEHDLLDFGVIGDFATFGTDKDQKVRVTTLDSEVSLCKKRFNWLWEQANNENPWDLKMETVRTLNGVIDGYRSFKVNASNLKSFIECCPRVPETTVK